MNIKEFIKFTSDKHNNMLRSLPASEVLLRRTTGIDWEYEFRQQGYVSIKKPRRTTPDEVFDWCKSTFGEDHYVVFYKSTGAAYTFWFDNSHNATMFLLKW